MMASLLFLLICAFAVLIVLFPLIVIVVALFGGASLLRSLRK